MENLDFLKKATNTINKIADIIEDNDKEGRFDIDLNNGIITLIDEKSGTYIINKQNAAKEIWLSSPVSGPYHFKYINDVWISSNQEKLFDLLYKELDIKII